jgi:succinyl-CoA synthetase beta subunit
VRCILINIFGGILRCDRVSAGLIQAAANSEMNLPMVVRLQGTNVDEGRRMLEASGLRFTVADGLYEAAEKAVALLQRE